MDFTETSYLFNEISQKRNTHCYEAEMMSRLVSTVKYQSISKMFVPWLPDQRQELRKDLASIYHHPLFSNSQFIRRDFKRSHPHMTLAVDWDVKHEINHFQISSWQISCEVLGRENKSFVHITCRDRSYAHIAYISWLSKFALYIPHQGIYERDGT